MVTPGVAGLSAFPWQTPVDRVLPLAVRMVLAPSTEDMRDFPGRSIRATGVPASSASAKAPSDASDRAHPPRA